MKILVAVAPVFSAVTSTVKVNVPALVGVPATLASGLFSRAFLTKRVPLGTFPDTSLNLNSDGPAGSLEV